MTTVRTNPIPLGVYWLDVFAPSLGSPNTANGEAYMVPWLAENIGSVVVKNREEKTAGTLNTQSPFPFSMTGPFTNAPAPFRFFYVFQVVKPPTNFPFEKLGFPTVVKLGGPDVILPTDTVTSDDTVQKAPEQSPIDALKEAVGTAGTYVVGGLLAYLAVKLVLDQK